MCMCCMFVILQIWCVVLMHDSEIPKGANFEDLTTPNCEVNGSTNLELEFSIRVMLKKKFNSINLRSCNSGMS